MNFNQILVRPGKILFQIRGPAGFGGCEATSPLDAMRKTAFDSSRLTLASRLPKRAVLEVVFSELLLLVLVRDNLTLNIIMLIRPSRGIKLWQAGG